MGELLKTTSAKAPDYAYRIDVSSKRLLSKETTVKALLTVLAVVIGVVMILPLLWMISASLKPEGEIFSYPIRWIPREPRWENYREVWAGIYPFGRFYANSIKVTVVSVTGLVTTSSLAAYSFAKLRYPGRDQIFMAYLATIMIPPQVLLVPKFILFRNIGLLDTHLALILPGMFVVFGVFLLRQFFTTIPDELSESARMDGCSHFTIWARIIMPLAKPALVSLVIVSFIWRWNDYEEALIFLNSKEMFTIPVGMTLFVDEFDSRYGLIMASAVSAVVPVITVFLIGQKFFVRGVITSGLKG